jgi:hypothetical protein
MEVGDGPEEAPHGGRNGAGARCSVDGGSRPVRALERRSRSGGSSDVPHGHMPTRTGEGRGADGWTPHYSAERRCPI